MIEIPEVCELELEARRLLRYRVPLVLAVAINFGLLIGMPAARVDVDTESASLAAATPRHALESAPRSRPASVPPTRAARDTSTANAESSATHSTTASMPVGSDEWLLMLANLKAATNWQNKGVPQHLLRWMTWQPRAVSLTDGPPAGAEPQTVVVDRLPALPATPPTTSPAPAFPESAPIAPVLEQRAVMPAANDVVQVTPALEQRVATSLPAGLIVRNPSDSGGAVSFKVNGRVCELWPGEAHVFTLGDTWDIQYHRGGSFGNARRQLAQGVYRFVVTDHGWDLEAVESTD